MMMPTAAMMLIAFYNGMIKVHERFEQLLIFLRAHRGDKNKNNCKNKEVPAQ
jgi:hypothetical protein